MNRTAATMNRVCVLLLMAVALHACGTRKAVQPAAVDVAPVPVRPDWVNARPVTDAYYVGIGTCPTARPDYLETAKKNALNDLASEISVTVEGNSLLYTLDRKYKFDEEFTSTISTRTKERIEGYELVDSYDDGDTYWTYYRLDKAAHARSKADRKQQALDQATDLYKRAQTSLKAGNLNSAFDLDLRGLVAMKEYWGGNDEVTVGDRTFPLANELYNNLQKMAGGVRFAVLPERCVLDWSNRYAREMLITSTYAANSKPLAQLPIVITWPGQSGKVTVSRNTDAEGRARITVQHLGAGTAALELIVRLDVDAWVGKDLDAAFTAPLTGGLTVPEVHVPIARVMPKFRVKGNEKNLGTPMAEAPLALALKEALTAAGFRAVARDADADLVVQLTANTREMGESNGFFTVALDEALKATDRRSGEVIYAGGKQGLKGIQLDFRKAGLDAYKKASIHMRNELAPAMIDAILQQ